MPKKKKKKAVRHAPQSWIPRSVVVCNAVPATWEKEAGGEATVHQKQQACYPYFLSASKNLARGSTLLWKVSRGRDGRTKNKVVVCLKASLAA